LKRAEIQACAVAVDPWVPQLDACRWSERAEQRRLTEQEIMNPLRRKRNVTAAAKDAAARPVYLGSIRADHYAQALRDPRVRATLARVIGKMKAVPPR
jgi:hypothetical protein